MTTELNQFSLLDTIAIDVHRSQADNDRLMALFPAVEPVPFPEGLRATIAWAQEQLV